MRSILYSQSATRTKGTAAATLTNPYFILHSLYKDDMRAAPASCTHLSSIGAPSQTEEWYILLSEGGHAVLHHSDDLNQILCDELHRDGQENHTEELTQDIHAILAEDTV